MKQEVQCNYSFRPRVIGQVTPLKTEPDLNNNDVVLSSSDTSLDEKGLLGKCTSNVSAVVAVTACTGMLHVVMSVHVLSCFVFTLQ